MSLGGNLKDIAIVDVIQLVNTTRKSGTLHVKNSRGEGKIVFDKGYIVSVNHPNDKFHIGTILVEMNAITAEELKQALEQQAGPGEDRKPLIAMLIEAGKVKKEAAFKGLEKLVEMTAVELVSHTRGTFTFNVEEVAAADDFRYFPDKLDGEVCMDTQMVLMEALRIYDEKVRDGEILEEPEEGMAESGEEGTTAISADDLGLGDLDRLEKKIPDVFSGIKAFDPIDFNRQIVKETLPDISEEEQGRMVSFLSIFSGGESESSLKHDGQSHAVILFSRDEFVKHAVITVLKNEGVLVIGANDEKALVRKTEQCILKYVTPVLVFDSPDSFGDGFHEEQIVRLRQEVRERYPQVCTIQLASPLDYSFYLQSFADGVRTVFPRPSKGNSRETFVQDMTRFLSAFQSYIVAFFKEHDLDLADNTRDFIKV